MISRSVPAMRIISLMLVVSVLSMTGCAGRQPMPVSVHQYGDDEKSCRALELEMQFTQDEINRLMPQTQKALKNVLLGAAGFFVIIPWFFMDLSKAEQIEVNAFRQRYNHLVVLATDKNCASKRQTIPDFKDKKAFEEFAKENPEFFGLTKEDVEKAQKKNEKRRGTEIQPKQKSEEDSSG